MNHFTEFLKLLEEHKFKFYYNWPKTDSYVIETEDGLCCHFDRHALINLINPIEEFFEPVLRKRNETSNY